MINQSIQMNEDIADDLHEEENIVSTMLQSQIIDEDIDNNF